MNTFQNGERVIIIDGPFVGMAGRISMNVEFKPQLVAKGLIRVIVKVFDRDVPVELEPWQVERM